MSDPLVVAQLPRASGQWVSGVASLEIERMMVAARESQSHWRDLPLSRRLAVVERFRHALAKRGLELAEKAVLGCRSTRAEKLASEVIPLADACLFLERSATKLLGPKNLGLGNRPVWLWGCSTVVERRPWGVVLIIAPGNYPLLLAGVQALQALVAGNAVLWKPADGGSSLVHAVADLLISCGLDPNLLVVLPESAEAARVAIAQGSGVDKVFFTGSARTGCLILDQLAPRLVPATLELSGCDACFVLESADLDLVARALAFGLRFNGSETCIAPRRVFVPRQLQPTLETKLLAALGSIALEPIRQRVSSEASRLVKEAVGHGARLVLGSVEGDQVLGPLVLANADPSMQLLQSDLFAPWVALVPVDDHEAMRPASDRCPFALGASVFGESKQSLAFAARVEAGSVVVNDLIVPTADPRVPFGGLRNSGFGVTRGPEGLLEMTTPRVRIVRSGSARPHFEPVSKGDESILEAFLRMSHSGSLGARIGACRDLLRAVRGRGLQKIEIKRVNGNQDI